MFPSITASNLPNHALCDAETSGQRPTRYGDDKLSNLQNVFICESRCGVLLAALNAVRSDDGIVPAISDRGHPSFSDCIGNIVLGRPEKEVIWPNAARCVAFMKNPQAISDWTIHKFPRKPMGANIGFRSNLKRAVAAVHDAARPEPTPISFINGFPESFDNGPASTGMPVPNASDMPVSPLLAGRAFLSATAETNHGESLSGYRR